MATGMKRIDCNAEYVLGAQGLQCQLGPAASSLIFQNVQLQLLPGELSLLEGPSGSGKTTLLWCLARMLPLQAGRLTLYGQPAEQIDVRSWRCQVGLVLQKPILVPGNVRDNLGLALRFKSQQLRMTMPSDEHLRTQLEALGLENIELERPVDQLSVGQAARICLLRSLVTQPDCLLLDEPCAHLDQQSASWVQEYVGAFVQQGKTALVVDHSGQWRRRAHTHLYLAEGQLQTARSPMVEE